MPLDKIVENGSRRTRYQLASGDPSNTQTSLYSLAPTHRVCDLGGKADLLFFFFFSNFTLHPSLSGSPNWVRHWCVRTAAKKKPSCLYSVLELIFLCCVLCGWEWSEVLFCANFKMASTLSRARTHLRVCAGRVHTMRKSGVEKLGRNLELRRWWKIM